MANVMTERLQDWGTRRHCVVFGAPSKRSRDLQQLADMHA